MKSTLRFTIAIVLGILALRAAGAPTAVTGVGAAFSPLLPNTPYRVFNDLMKQSSVFVPYAVSTGTWVPYRQWGINISLGADLYPTTLPTNIYA